MDGLLTAVKTVRAQAGDEKTLFIRQVGTTPSNGLDKDAATISASSEKETPGRSPQQDWNAENVLQLLKSSPDVAETKSALKWLLTFRHHPGNFDICLPGPLQAQIVHVLVTESIPAQWPNSSSQEKQIIRQCLSNLAGINALVARLRLLSTQREAEDQQTCLLDVLEGVLRGDDFILKLWTDLQNLDSERSSRLIWADSINVLASGKIVATVAQARDNVARESTIASRWLESGLMYAEWLAKNVANLASSSVHESTVAAASMMTKSLSLGYSSSFLQALMIGISKQNTSNMPHSTLSAIFAAVQPSFRLRLLEHVVKWVTEHFPTPDQLREHSWGQSDEVAAVAALLDVLTSHGANSSRLLASFLTEPQLAASTSIVVRRACLACINQRLADDVEGIMEKIMGVFGDPLFIKHAPFVQQDAMAQNLLLTAKAVHSASPMSALLLTRSSAHLQGVSNRLESMTQRSRWLGMIVATSISSLVDKVAFKIDFGTEDMQTDEAERYRYLITILDRVGDLSTFTDTIAARQQSIRKSAVEQESKPLGQVSNMPKIDGRPVFGPVPPPKPKQTEIIGDRIQELTDEDGQDLDEFKPYAKPDSDAEDSDDDATLVNRNKPRPPVYIRDLLSMLQETEKSDRFQIGLESASKLIRRKTSFGKEASDHAEELLRLLCNLQDPFDIPNFDALRLQAMVATLLADVDVLAPWLCRHVFEGEYSFAQRCVMMSTLGLAGRELAGFKEEDSEFDPSSSTSEKGVGKTLPSRLHAIYSASAASSTKQLDATSKQLEQTFLQPLALTAADRSTAHLNAVKIRTFSSRLSETNRTRRKPAVNKLGRIFATHFFAPLVTRYQQDVAAYGSGSLFASVPILLITLIKSLAILFHASGPATAQLSAITGEFWDFLLCLRTVAAGEQSVMEATLFALLTLLEVNSDNTRLLATEHAKAMAQTNDWVQFVFDRVSHGGGKSLDVRGSEVGPGDEGRVQSLAAGILIRIHDITEEMQKAFMGTS